MPEGLGYPLFGRIHLLCLLVTCLGIIVFILLSLRASEKGQRRIIVTVPFVLIALEAAKDLLLTAQGKFWIGYLPLFPCSIGIYVFLFYFAAKKEEAKHFWGEVALSFVLPCGIFGLLFADWTVSYPVFSFYSLHSYIWHTLLIFYPLFLRLSGRISLRFRDLWMPVAFTGVTAALIYAFDRMTGMNYFWLTEAEPGTPLAFFEDRLGNPGYLLPYAGMAVSVFAGIHIIDFLLKKIRV